MKLPSMRLIYGAASMFLIYCAIFGMIVPALLNVLDNASVVFGAMLFLGSLISIPFVVRYFIVKYRDEQKVITTTHKEN